MDTNEIRKAIHLWIQLDAPLTVKMTLLPEHVDLLIDKLKDIK